MRFLTFLAFCTDTIIKQLKKLILIIKKKITENNKIHLRKRLHRKLITKSKTASKHSSSDEIPRLFSLLKQLTNAKSHSQGPKHSWPSFTPSFLKIHNLFHQNMKKKITQSQIHPYKLDKFISQHKIIIKKHQIEKFKFDKIKALCKVQKRISRAKN